MKMVRKCTNISKIVVPLHRESEMITKVKDLG